jgi:periplasmic copper chaperone A
MGCFVRAARLLLCFVLPAVLAAPAFAHSYKLGTVEIGHVWAPPSTEAGASVYGPLFQSGFAPDRLIAASSPAGDAVALEDKQGVARPWGDGLELKPGEPVSLAAFGDHLEVTGLKQPLKEGDSFPLTLRFEDAGSITVDVLVEKTPGE